MTRIAEDAARIREMVAEDYAERTSFLRGPKRAPFEQEFPRYPLNYPKVKY